MPYYKWIPAFAGKTIGLYKWIPAFAGKTILILIMVTACSPHIPEQHICLQKCAKIFKLCQARCFHSCNECKQENIRAAERGYCQYIRELKVQNGWITRQLQSYRDPLKCRQITCNCEVDRVICQNAC